MTEGSSVWPVAKVAAPFLPLCVPSYSLALPSFSTCATVKDRSTCNKCAEKWSFWSAPGNSLESFVGSTLAAQEKKCTAIASTVQMSGLAGLAGDVLCSLFRVFLFPAAARRGCLSDFNTKIHIPRFRRRRLFSSGSVVK